MGPGVSLLAAENRQPTTIAKLRIVGLSCESEVAFGFLFHVRDKNE
jgi:hypothetical protein